VVVVAPEDSRFGAALKGLGLRLVPNPEPERGISRSIELGVKALTERGATGQVPQIYAIAIGVADQPHLTPAAIRRLAEAFAPGRIVVPRYGDHRGNPVIFDMRFFPELCQLEGDRGGQVVASRHPQDVIEVELPEAAGVDIDRPEDWPAEPQ
jgi:CTP:molybdopterin cytidylyltransferase MocA